MTTTRWANVRRRVVPAAVLACLPALVSAPSPAQEVQRPRPPKTVEQGAWWFDAMRLGAAHEQATGKGATIALIDSALDTSVPELQGADIRLRLDCNGNRARPLTGPGASHGTAQAALLVGNGRGNAPGGEGVRGIAPDATVLAYDNDLEPGTDHIECPAEGFRRMFRDAVRQGADVISVASTLGADVFPVVTEAVSSGVVVVAAAGADDVAGHVYPADAVGVVSVNAVDEGAQPWKHNRNTGSPVISAPGVFVGSGGISERGWSSLGWGTGTSAATSITSGALALVESRYPDATGNQLIQHLIHYTGGEGGYYWDEDYGFGIVSVTRMLQTSPTQWPDENPLGKKIPDAVDRYPMSASSLVEDEPVAGEPAAGEPAASAGTAGPIGTGSWVWVAAGLALLVAAGGVALAARRRRAAEGEVGPAAADEHETVGVGNERRGA
ncbi:MAG TPA: S8 family serine peptidase [Nocardioidaceae bacterium]|nr:S8 family serine peptidase [Nocardioidaceae bacterium]